MIVVSPEKRKTIRSVRELANDLNVSVATAYKLVKTPGFPVIRVGKRFLIPEVAYNKWLATAGGNLQAA